MEGAVVPRLSLLYPRSFKQDALTFGVWLMRCCVTCQMNALPRAMLCEVPQYLLVTQNVYLQQQCTPQEDDSVRPGRSTTPAYLIKANSVAPNIPMQTSIAL